MFGEGVEKLGAFMMNVSTAHAGMSDIASRNAMYNGRKVVVISEKQ